MHDNGWFSVKSGAKTMYLQHQQRKQNILNQQFNPKAPNEVWISDVTYFKLNGKTYYICVVLDLYARKLLSLTVSKRNSTWLTKNTLQTAYDLRTPDTTKLLFHSDQGRNYTSKAFMDLVLSLGIKQSFSKKGTPYDNSVCESFFNTLKREELYRTAYTSEKHLRESLTKYMHFYNADRPHSYNRNSTPDKAEAKYFPNLSQK